MTQSLREVLKAAVEAAEERYYETTPPDFADASMKRGMIADAVRSTLELWLAENGLKIVPVEMLRQIYGMANEGCVASTAAYRWCERIDEVMHAGGPLGEYEPFAADLPEALSAAPDPLKEPKP